MTTPRLIRGKTVRQWATELGLSRQRVYKLLRRGRLEARIDGTWQPTERKTGTKHFGKTVEEWATELGRSKTTIYNWLDNGNLKRVAAGKKPIDHNLPALRVCGKTLAQCAKRLKVSRQRAYQMYHDGTLEARMNGTWQPRPSGRKPSEATQQLYEQILAAYNPEQPAYKLAGRFNVAPDTVYRALRAAGITLALGRPRKGYRT